MQIKDERRFCQMLLLHASKVPLLTFDSCQRPDIFDAHQSCVKANVKSALKTLIHLSTIVHCSPTLLHLMQIKGDQSQVFVQC